ncbi:hypothetical protein L345_15640, partial [Ophiophagus hannah]
MLAQLSHSGKMAEGRNLGALERECKLCEEPGVKLLVEQQASQRVPQESIRVMVVMEDIACQLGAHPKSPTEWSGSTSIQQMERALLGQATLPDPLINWPLTAARESRAMILEAWSYIERHGNEFHDEAELVQFLGDNLEEESSEWFTQLNDEGAPELNNVDDFLRELRSHFEDSSQAQEAEAEIKKSLDEELLKICLCHGLPEDRIYEWYRMAIKMDNALRQHRKSNAEKQPKRQFTRHSFPCQGEGRQTAAPPTSLKCFHCGQQGHRASECLAPALIPSSETKKFENISFSYADDETRTTTFREIGILK